jgi:hypothetical protein
MAVGGGDVGLAVQAEQADGQAATGSEAITRGAIPVLTSDLSSC